MINSTLQPSDLQILSRKSNFLKKLLTAVFKPPTPIQLHSPLDDVTFRFHMIFVFVPHLAIDLFPQQRK